MEDGAVRQGGTTGSDGSAPDDLDGTGDDGSAHRRSRPGRTPFVVLGVVGAAAVLVAAVGIFLEQLTFFGVEPDPRPGVVAPLLALGGAGVVVPVVVAARWAKSTRTTVVVGSVLGAALLVLLVLVALSVLPG